MLLYILIPMPILMLLDNILIICLIQGWVMYCLAVMCISGLLMLKNIVEGMF